MLGLTQSPPGQSAMVVQGSPSLSPNRHWRSVLHSNVKQSSAQKAGPGVAATQSPFVHSAPLSHALPSLLPPSQMSSVKSFGVPLSSQVPPPGHFDVGVAGSQSIVPTATTVFETIRTGSLRRAASSDVREAAGVTDPRAGTICGTGCARAHERRVLHAVATSAEARETGAGVTRNAVVVDGFAVVRRVVQPSSPRGVALIEEALVGVDSTIDILGCHLARVARFAGSRLSGAFETTGTNGRADPAVARVTEVAGHFGEASTVALTRINRSNETFGGVILAVGVRDASVRLAATTLTRGQGRVLERAILTLVLRDCAARGRRGAIADCVVAARAEAFDAIVSECSFCAGCNNAVCDTGASAATCASPQNEGEEFSFENPPLASCQSGSCQSDACVSDADCNMTPPNVSLLLLMRVRATVLASPKCPATSVTRPRGRLQQLVPVVSKAPLRREAESSDACQVATEDVDCGVNTNECLLESVQHLRDWRVERPGVLLRNRRQQRHLRVTRHPVSPGPLHWWRLRGELLRSSARPVPHIVPGRGSNSGSFPYIAAGSSPEIVSKTVVAVGTMLWLPATPTSSVRVAALVVRGTPNDFTTICDGGSNDGNACDSGAECTNGNCVAATPGPAFCALDCFTFECSTDLQCLFGDDDEQSLHHHSRLVATTLTPARISSSRRSPGGACVFPTLTEFCPYIGCQVVSNTLKNQLAIDTFLFLDVSSTGLKWNVAVNTTSRR